MSFKLAGYALFFSSHRFPCQSERNVPTKSWRLSFKVNINESTIVGELDEWTAIRDSIRNVISIVYWLKTADGESWWPTSRNRKNWQAECSVLGELESHKNVEKSFFSSSSIFKNQILSKYNFSSYFMKKKRLYESLTGLNNLFTHSWLRLKWRKKWSV